MLSMNTPGWQLLWAAYRSVETGRSRMAMRHDCGLGCVEILQQDGDATGKA